jgi:hypothetical protein
MARLRARARPRSLRACDAAVSEVLGYILMFFLSAAVLVFSLQAFMQSRDASSDLQVAQQMKLVADRVAAEVLQAGIVAGEFPNSTYQVRIPLPQMRDRAYYVNVSEGTVWANTTDGSVAADAPAFEVQELGVHLAGTVYGSQGYALVRYDRPSANWKTITISI